MINKGGAPFGNKNGEKGRLITEQIIRELKSFAPGEDGKPTRKLRLLANRLVSKACDGDLVAAKMVLDRAEGAVRQEIEASGEGLGLVINVVKFTEALDNATIVDNGAIENKSIKTDT